MKHTRKILVTLLLLMTILVSLAVVAIPASAATMTGGEVLYLVPSEYWNQSNARFAIYLCNGSSSATWVSMTKVGDQNLWVAKVPSGNYKNVIFVRMNPSTTANNWNSGVKWNQTADLTYDGTNNCYAVKESTWDKGGGTWFQATFTAVGSTTASDSDGALFGTGWDPSNTANDLVKQSDGTYKKVYTGVPAGSYKMKVAFNHAWTSSWPSSNKNFTVTHSNSTVTIVFNPTSGSITVTVACEHTNKTTTTNGATCTDTGTETTKCSACGATISTTTIPATGHTWVDADCDSPKTCSVCNATEGEALGHNYVNDYCTECGGRDPEACDHEYTYDCDKICIHCHEETRPDADHSITHTDAVAAGCTTNGNVEYWSCSICNYVWTDEALTQQSNAMSVVIPAGHAWVAADCDSPKTCSVCNATEGDALGHTPGSAATCTTAQTCTVCSEVLVAALGHDAADGSCSRCAYRFVYFVNSENWSKVNAHAWITDGASTAWPGTAMTKTGETVHGFDVYKIEFTVAYENVIFNDGSSQTADLVLETGKYYDLSNQNWYDSLNAVPDPDPLKTKDTLAGTFNSWNAGSHSFRLEEVGGTVSYIYLELEANKTYEFKILKNGAWYGCTATITNSVVDYQFYSTNNDNCKITTTVAGTYVFALNGTKLSVTYPHVHSYTESVTTAAGCETDGLKTFTCSCGDSYTETIEALGHDLVDVAGQAATCTAPGYTEYKDCSRCDYIEGKETIAAKNHANVETDYKPATCTEAGYTKIICKDCGVTITSTPHSAKGHSEETILGYAATCTEDGLSDGKKCSVCGITTLAQETIPATGHVNTTTDSKDATCTEDGYTKVTCACGHVVSDKVLPATGHTWVAGEVVKPTCTVAGYTNYSCACGATKTGDTVAATGHSYSEVVTKPTCTAGGYTTYTCSCGDTYTGNETAKLGHTYVGTITKPATCGEAGVKTYKCSCGDSYTEAINATGEHNYSQGTCGTCGAVDTNYKNVTFVVPAGVSEVVMGNGNILPTADAPDEYTFIGWSESPVEETTTKPTILAAGSEYTGSKTVLYALYSFTETTPGVSEFVKVTSAPSDWSGQYLIVYEAGKVAFNGGLTTLDATKNTISVTIANSKISATDATKAAMFTIAKSGSNYTIKSASGYYIGQTSNNNGLVSNKTTTYTNTITLNGTNVDIKSSGSAYLRFNASSGQERFRYFKSSTYTSQKAIQLYKLVESAGSSVTKYVTLGELCDHTYETSVTAPTCTTGGYTTYTCSKCGESYEADETAALGHTEVTVAGKAATCDETGLTEGKKCSVCGTVIVAQNTIPVLGHNYVDGKCSICGEKQPNEATITFDNTSKRTEFSVDKQVWVENGITVTNLKTNDSSNLADNCNPIRFYKHTKLTIAFPGMTKIEVNCNTEEYAASLKNSVGAAATVSGKVVTITFSEAVDTYTAILSDGQVRVDSIKVYAKAECSHENTTETVVDATCTAAGSTTVTCDDCHEVVSTTEIPAKGHDYKAVVTAPTCTEKGYTTYTCSCGDTYTGNETDKIAHSNHTVKHKDPTCTESGYDQFYCGVCGNLDNTVSIPASGHKWANATCTTPKTCTVCSATEGDVIAHTEVSVSGYAATCTATGLTDGKKCSVCGVTTLAQEIIPVKAHTEVTLPGYAATCTATGLTDGKKCTVCGTVTKAQESIDSLGHNIVVDKAVDATCTETGLTAGEHCTRCDYKIAQTVVPTIAHSYNAVVTAPTFDAQGYTTYTCSKCGNKYISDYTAALVAVAQIGGEKYESLQAALDAAQNGDRVVLLSDIQISKYLDVKTANNGAVARNFTLDLNGHTISTASGYNYNSGYPVLFIGINQTVTLEGNGTIVAEKKVTVGVYGTIYVKSGNIVNNGTTEDDAAFASFYWNNDLPSYEGIVGGTAYIQGGNFVGTVYADTPDEDGSASLEISGGTFDSDVTEYCADGFDCKDNGDGSYGIILHVHSYNKVITAPTCTDKGYTTYTCACGDSYVADHVDALGHDYKAVVTAPTFDAQGYTTYTCSKCGDKYVSDYTAALVAVAQIGGEKYESLEDAFEAVADGDTILLLADATVDSTIVVNKKVNIDLNGEAINAAYVSGSTTNHIYVFEIRGELTLTGNGTINTRGIKNYGKLTLENGTINAIDGNGGYAVVCYAGASFVMNGGTVAAIYEDDHRVTEGGYDATSVRIEAGASFILNGGTINNVSDWTFAIDNHGSVTINGGDVTSVHSTISNYGTLTINDGKFTCNGLEGITAHVVVAWDGSTTTINGGTFDGKDNYNGFNVDADEGAAVEIKGGNFLSVHSGSLYGKGSIVVSGGKFFDAVPADRCAEGFEPKANGDGTYGVALHVHSYNASVTAPTCTTEGYTTYTCACGDSYVADHVDALGHTEVIDAAVAATCTETGLTEGKHCSVCNEVLVAQTVVDALGHSYNAVVTAPTCTENGYTTYTCSCGDSYVADHVDALGHTETIDAAVAPTCTATGLTEGKHCSVCNEVLVAQTVVDALGHTEVVDAAVAPTCTETGLTEGKHCSVCNEVLVAQTVVAAIGHDHDAVVTAPTFTDKGYTTHTCVNCGDSYVDSYVDALIAAVEINGVKYTSIQAAINAANAGDVITLVKDVELDATIVLDGGVDITLDLAGYTVIAGFDSDIVEVILAKNGAKLTITGNGTMLANGNGEHVEVISSIDGAIVTIENGTFVSDGCTTIYATRGGIVNIEGGSYEAKELYNGMRFLLDVNEKEANLGVINVYGGVFYNFNPASHNNDDSYSNKLVNGAECTGLLSAVAKSARTSYTSAVYYVGEDSIEAALEAAQNGDTIVLQSDIALDDGLVIDKDITLDLNGKTISMNDDATVAENRQMILNKGNLTITGDGKLSYNYTGVNLGTSYAANTITSEPGSVLTIKNGTVENLTYDSAIIAYTIDGRTNGSAGDVTINIEGGVISSERQSVRIFANSTTNVGALNISGGSIIGRVIVQNASASANKATLTITGGEFNANAYKSDVLYVGGSNNATIDIDATVNGGTFNGAITDTNVGGFISGGTFTTDVSKYCVDDMTCTSNGDGTFGIVEAVASINGVKYASFDEAYAAAQAGDTILLLADLNAGVLVIDKNVTINGGGFTIAASITINVANVNATITNAKIVGTAGQAAVITINADARLYVTDSVISASGEQFILLVDGTREAYVFIDSELVPVNGEVFSGDPYEVVVYFRSEYSDELAVRGFITKDAGDGMIVVKNTLPYHIGADGYWYFNGEKTEYKAVGTDGNNFTIGEDGYWYLNGTKTEYKAVATDADQYTIGADGYWYLNGTKTEYKAIGTNGDNYTIGSDGYWYLNGTKTEYKAVGTDGDKVEIGADGYWYINGTKTEYKAEGEDGKTPSFKVENGNLWASFDNVNWTDLGQVKGEDGKTPKFQIVDGVLQVSYDDGATWADVGPVAGENGLNGKTPKFQIVDGVLQVSYDDGATWADVGPVAGENGLNGKTPKFQIVDGVLQVSYDEGATWADVGPVAGADGINGKTPKFQIVEGVLQVSYDDGATWADVGPVAGADGINGKTPKFQIVDGVLQVSYDDGATWADVGPVAGENGLNGKTPDFQIVDGILQVSYDDGATWTNVGPVAGEDGKTPTFQIVDGILQVSYNNGTTWTNVGPVAGANGLNGINGKTPKFQIVDGVLQVSYDEGATWADVGTVAGENGQNGLNGKTPKFQIVEGVLQVSYDEGATWADVGPVAGADGINGKTPKFQIVEGVLQVSYDDGATWADVGTVVGANGINGKTPKFQIVDGVLQVSYDEGSTWADVGTVVGADGINGKTPKFQIVEGVLQVSYDDGATWADLGTVAGKDGINGKTPKFEIRGTNLWVSYDDGATWADLGTVVGTDGLTPSISENGNWIIGGVETDVPAIGKDGIEYTIGEDGYWYANGVKTEYKAVGVDGKTPTFKVENGHLFVSYDDVNWADLGQIVGNDGITPHIGENGNWWIGETDTGISASGTTPHIGENGNWWIGDVDTGIAAQGADGNDNNEIVVICIGIAGLCLITSIVAIATKRRRRWWMF